jgi:hypothetical protein
MPPTEEIDMSGTFDFVRLNLKAQKAVRNRTEAIIRALGDNDERKIVLFTRLLRMMCQDAGRPAKQVQLRLDACKLSVHCLYDIALGDATDGKMVNQLVYISQQANFKRCLFVISLFAKSTPSVFSVEQMTSLEPYLKPTAEKDDQEVAFLVVVIYRSLLELTQLTFQPDFLSRAMTTIASSMTSVSLKVS